MAFNPTLVPSNQKITLTLDSSPISSDQIDFPLTVVLDGTDPLYAALFTDLGANSLKLSIQSGATQLPVEIEYFDSVAERAVLHTKVPTYSHTANNALVLSYDSTQDNNTGYVGYASDSDPTVADGVESNIMSGVSGTNRRLIISTAALTAHAGRIRLKFCHHGTDWTIDSVYLFYQASTGDVYDGEAGSGVQVTMNGAASFTITADSNLSDPIDFPIDGTKALLISTYCSGVMPYNTSQPANCQYWYRTTSNQASLANVSSYTQSTTWPIVRAVLGVAPAREVWDSNFDRVYHNAQDPSGTAPQLLDSTANGHDLTTAGTMTTADLVDGLFGKGIEFDGVDDKASSAVSDFSALETTATIEVLVKWGSVTAGDVALSIGGAAGTLQITVGSSASYIGNGVSGDMVDTAIVPATAAFQHLAHTLIGGTLTAYGNGVADPVTNAVTVADLSSTSLIIGARYDGSYAEIITGEVRVSKTARSADWIKLTYLSLTDQLITPSQYTASAVIRAFIDIPYGDLISYHRVASDMIYSLLFDRRQITEMIYSLRLGAHVDMRYGDCPELRSVINMHYGDCPLLRRALAMSYGDLLMHRHVVDMPYAIPRTLVAAMEMRYSIAEAELRAFTDMSYDLLVNNPLRRALVMPYLMEGDGLVRSVGATVLIAGLEIPTNHLSIEPDTALYCIPVELHLTRESDYYQIERGDVIEVTLDSTTYHLVVETKEISRNERASITWIVKGLSPAVWLSAPWSRPVLRSFDDGSAVSIIEGLIAEVPQLAGLPAVDWQIDDFPVVGLYANDEDRHEIITKILQTVDAILLSNPDGSLRVVYDEPPDLLTREPDYYISSERNFLAADETTVHVEGWNRFLIGNQLASEERLFAEQRDISAALKEVLGFQTPWDDALVVVLQHSGGEWVPEPEYMGVVEEIYPPVGEDPEQIEFVAGFAQTSRPIYDDPEITWTREQLGAITWAEDGRLEAELKDGRTDGYSLAEVRYLTRYHLWRVRNDRDEDVQYLLRIVEAG